jgi:hypothetical protein
VASVAGAAEHASAGTIRHDVDPQAYVNLGTSPIATTVGRLDVNPEGASDAPGFNASPAIGSATLVAPNWALTAAHVMESARSAQFMVGDHTYNAEGWVLHPKYTGDLRRGYDLALVKLTEQVPNVTPAPLYHGRRELGQTVTLAGYGRTGTGLTGDVTDDRVRRAGTNRIDGTVKDGRGGQLVLSRKLPRNARTFAMDFDNPAEPSQSTMGPSFATPFEFLISRGDSGGGAFIDFGNGIPMLVGVHSFGEFTDGEDDSDYGDITGHTRVSRFSDWVDMVIDSDGRARHLRFISPSAADVAVASVSGASPRVLDLGAGADTPSQVIPEPGAAAAAALLAAPLLLRRRRARQPLQ